MKLQECLERYNTAETSDIRKRSFQRLLSFGKHLVDPGCCHPVQVDLQHVLTSPRQEGGKSFPGISNYHSLGKIDETQLW
jgi:hypothetical protein